MLKPLDLVVGLKVHLWPDVGAWSYERLAIALGISPSQAHMSLARLARAGLYRGGDRSLRTHSFTLFAAHGIPFAFPAEPGALTYGMPTAHSAPPLCDQLAYAEAYVWPGTGGVSGRSVPPLHQVAPEAAATDARLYGALALIDALRVGRARDRALAVEGLERLLSSTQRDSRWLEAHHTAWDTP